jgi:hypothetical protein
METKINTTKPELKSSHHSAKHSIKCFTRAADALFELLEALLCSLSLPSLPELSCAPVFRRQWPSLYEALPDGELDREQLLKHCVEVLPASRRPLLVGDHTSWGRPQARTLKDRLAIPGGHRSDTTARACATPQSDSIATLLE